MFATVLQVAARNKKVVPRSFARLTLPLVCCWMLGVRLVLAQPARPADAPAATERPMPPNEPIRETKPEVYYLKDKDGKLQPVLGFTLDDFEKLLLRTDKGQGDQRPGYRIEQLTATGTIQQGRAELAVDATFFVSDKNWVRVPLRLGAVVLREKAKYAGPGESFVEFDDASQEYVVWLKGQSDQPHRVTLKMLAPIASIGGQNQLKLSLPRALNSELTLKVPGAHAIGQVSTGAVLDSTQELEDGTEFKVLGPAGDFVLSWRLAAQRIVSVPAVLEAVGAVMAKVDGRSINTVAQLTVRSFGGEFDSFRLRLPAGASLVPAEYPDYTVEAIPNDAPADAATRRGEMVDVRLRSKTLGPVVVRLVTEQPHSGGNGQAWLDLAGFEVQGAVRQWGHIGVQVLGGWQIVWGRIQQVRQVEELPAEQRRDDLAAAFEYFAQPFALPVRVSPQETRIAVEPEYLVLVDGDQIHLEARLKYHVSGAKAFALAVDLAEWDLDADGVGPTNLIDANRIAASEKEPLSLPLLQPTTGEVEVRLRAHRPILPVADQVEFGLPRPHANTLGPATLFVLPADNVDLTIHDKDLRGLRRQRLKSSLSLPVRQQEYFSFRGEQADLRFAAGFRLLQRTVTVESSVKVTIAAMGGNVLETLHYQVDREPISRLTLEAPAELGEPGRLDARLDGQPLAVSPSNTDSPSAKTVRLRVDLPAPRTGAFELILGYDLSKEKLLPQTSVPLHVPLAMPVDGEWTGSRAKISASEGVHVRPLPGRWRVPAGVQAAPGETRLESGERVDAISLVAHLDGQTDSTFTLVERAWVQSWFGDAVRQDRAVYRLVTSHPSLKVQLPTGAELDEVLLDDQAPTSIEPGQTSNDWIIWLTPTGAEQPRKIEHYRLELRYGFADRGPRGSQLSIAAPVLADTRVQQVYWQLILPPHEHLLAGPKGWTDEFAWAWEGSYFGRQPLLEQPQLEAWIGAASDKNLPEGTNRYLFSTLDASPTIDIRTTSRSWIVFTASGAALSLGLLLIYVPASRHPALLLGGSLLVLALGAIYPEPTLFFAQAASFGLLLTLLAGWLERGMARRRKRAGLLRGMPSSIIDRGSTQTHHRSLPLGAPTSTETVALPQFSGSEPKA